MNRKFTKTFFRLLLAGLRVVKSLKKVQTVHSQKGGNGMTNAQVQYLANLEAARHNRVTEEEQQRHNKAVEFEANRQATVGETETRRHNLNTESTGRTTAVGNVAKALGITAAAGVARKFVLGGADAVAGTAAGKAAKSAATKAAASKTAVRSASTGTTAASAAAGTAGTILATTALLAYLKGSKDAANEAEMIAKGAQEVGFTQEMWDSLVPQDRKGIAGNFNKSYDQGVKQLKYLKSYFDSPKGYKPPWER